MTAVDLIGYAGALLTVATYAMRGPVALRVTGILSSLAFFLYGYMTDSRPVMLMETILLMLNVWRLAEMLREGEGRDVEAPSRAS